MIEIHIAKTCKFSPRSEWQRYDDSRQSFEDMKQAREWLREEYGTSKRAAMYRDRKDGPPIKCGYVIGFRPPYRSKGEAILEQHWVSFRESNPLEL